MFFKQNMCNANPMWERKKKLGVSDFWKLALYKDVIIIFLKSYF